MAESEPATRPEARKRATSDRQFWISWAVRIFVIAWLIGSFFGYPLEKESVNSDCSALAISTFNEPSQPQSLTRRIAAGTGGLLLESKMEQDYPNYPPAAVCAAIWWANLLSPNLSAVRAYETGKGF